MIEIEELKHGSLCQNCFSNENVKEISIHTNGVGTIIRLCANCRRDLAKKLNETIDAEICPYFKGENELCDDFCYLYGVACDCPKAENYKSCEIYDTHLKNLKESDK